jgi:hypothetical protein
MIQARLFDVAALCFKSSSDLRGFAQPMTDRVRAMLEGLKAPKPDRGEIAHADKLVEAFWKSEKGERKMLDVLPLGPERIPSGVHLSSDPGTVSALVGLSPSGTLAAMWSQWKVPALSGWWTYAGSGFARKRGTITERRTS